jgi:pimeloyl-ACP methyl ester carboxylesterase
MRRKGTLTALLTAVVCAAATLACAAAPADAATSSINFVTCADEPSFGCAHLQVPLDPSGAVPGTISLAIRRELSQNGAATEAVVALAGGPGQAALPFAADTSQIVSQALKTDDLVVFDQRGTGDSGALLCPVLGNFTVPLSDAIPHCATEIGSTRGFYTTDDSVADVEAIRKALGYTKLILYGTSYGTKVALRYAAAYPGNVAGLILDSTVPPNGPDVFDQATYQAVPRILAQLCAGGACPGIADPLADLRKVLRRLARRPALAHYVESTGKEDPLKITAGDLAQVLVAGDDDPSLRADFPAAVAAAAGGQYALLGVLVAHGVLGQLPNKTVDNAVFFDTECEELPFPWTRSEPAQQRLSEALAAARAMPPGSFGPFSYRTAVDESSAADCAYWPFATAAAEPAIPSLPNVPTLIVSGADDLRTPTANARAVAAMIPDATVVVVPQTGHSVLTTEFTACGRDAVTAFFSGATINTHCKARSQPRYLRPAPAAPASLAPLRPLPGTRGVVGKTARAFELTLGWVSRELSESLFETLIGSYNPAFSKGLGGLHGGFVKQTSNKNPAGSLTVHYHDFSYIPGLTLTGAISNGVGHFKLGGARASSGALVATRSDQFSGTIGGVRVRFSITQSDFNALNA